MSYNGRESARINAKEPPLGQYVEEADYVIFKENGVIKAKDGSDGSIAFQNAGTCKYHGSDVPDASPVIQSAIDAVGDKGVIFIEAGEYYLGSKLLIDSSVRITGAGMNNTYLYLGDGVDDDIAETTGSYIFELEHVKLQGNNANQTVSDIHGVHNTGTNELQLHNLEIRNCMGSAVYQDYNGGYNTISECFMLNAITINKCAEQLVTDSYIQRVEITGGESILLASNRMVGSQILLSGGQHISILGNTFRDQSLPGVKFSDLGSAHDYHALVSNNVVVTDPSAEPVSYGLYLGDNTGEVIVKGNKFVGSYATVIGFGNTLGTNKLLNNIPDMVSRGKTLQLKDSDGNLFAKIEDTANGGMVTVYDETGDPAWDLDTDGGGNLRIEGQGTNNILVRGRENDDMEFIGGPVCLGTLDINTQEVKNFQEGTGASDPTSVAPDGWIVITTQAGNTRYIPFYT